MKMLKHLFKIKEKINGNEIQKILPSTKVPSCLFAPNLKYLEIIF
jgi:hypothetical protein